MLVGHDWGGELGWIFAHRYSRFISRLRPGPRARLGAIYDNPRPRGAGADAVTS